MSRTSESRGRLPNSKKTDQRWRTQTKSTNEPDEKEEGAAKEKLIELVQSLLKNNIVEPEKLLKRAGNVEKVVHLNPQEILKLVDGVVKFPDEYIKISVSRQSNYKIDNTIESTRSRWDFGRNDLSLLKQDNVPFDAVVEAR